MANVENVGLRATASDLVSVFYSFDFNRISRKSVLIKACGRRIASAKFNKMIQSVIRDDSGGCAMAAHGVLPPLRQPSSRLTRDE